MESEELVNIWKRFEEKNDFMLNPDTDFVMKIADGVLSNEKEKGLRLCPCRIGDGTREGNIGLLCPCNFKAHESWKKEGRCWCGLFVKRK